MSLAETTFAKLREAHLFFNVVAERHERWSVVLAGNLPFTLDVQGPPPTRAADGRDGRAIIPT